MFTRFLFTRQLLLPDLYVFVYVYVDVYVDVDVDADVYVCVRCIKWTSAAVQEYSSDKGDILRGL